MPVVNYCPNNWLCRTTIGSGIWSSALAPRVALNLDETFIMSATSGDDRKPVTQITDTIVGAISLLHHNGDFKFQNTL